MNIVYVDIYIVMWLAIVRAVEKPSRPGWIWVLILLMKGCHWMHGICHAMNIHVLCSFWRYLKIIRAHANWSIHVPIQSLIPAFIPSILPASLSFQLLACAFVHVLGNSDMFVHSIWITTDMHYSSRSILFYFTRQISFDWFIWCLFLLAWHLFLHYIYIYCVGSSLLWSHIVL